jgi:hypothetical protein
MTTCAVSFNIGVQNYNKGFIREKAFKIYTTFCRPRIIYGLEAVPLTKGDEQELLSFERRLFLPPLTMTTSLFVELMVTLSLLVSLCTISGD